MFLNNTIKNTFVIDFNISYYIQRTFNLESLLYCKKKGKTILNFVGNSDLLNEIISKRKSV